MGVGGTELWLIKKKGRWKSNAILAYLESYLTIGASAKAAALTFENLPDASWINRITSKESVSREIESAVREKEEAANTEKMRRPEKPRTPQLLQEQKGNTSSEGEGFLDEKEDEGEEKKEKKVPIKLRWRIGEKVRMFTSVETRNKKHMPGILSIIKKVHKNGNVDVEGENGEGTTEDIKGDLCEREMPLSKRKSTRPAWLS